MTREASADTRSAQVWSRRRRSDDTVAARSRRCRLERRPARSQIDQAAAQATRPEMVVVPDVIEAVSQQRSSWARADVLQAICDLQRPVAQQPGHGWAGTLDRATDHVIAQLVDLDPPGETTRRGSDGRSVWIEPTAPRFTSEPVLAQEEEVITWAMAAQADPPAPSTTVNCNGLDGLQADAAAAVAGDDRLVLVVGPAGAGKTRMLSAAADDLHARGRVVLAVAPTAKAARTVERDTGVPAGTVAKLLHEWERTDRPPLPEFRLPAGATLIVDEAGMLSTPALHRIVSLSERNGWRLALVGDPRQLQGVGRGGMLAELCANGRVEQLERLYRFTHAWEAAASLRLRCGDPAALDAYEAHGRIVAGPVADHLAHLAATWIDQSDSGRSVAVVASTNDHVDTVNRSIQTARLTAGHLDPDVARSIAAGEMAYVGDVVATRRNDRRLVTSRGEPVRNRETWTVAAINDDGSLTATHEAGHGDITLPADYVGEHVRLGYAATEHGWQSDTVDIAIALASPATTRRGLYVAATRGSARNVICVVTDSHDLAEARDVLEMILATDRADIPATTHRRTLAQSTPRRRQQRQGQRHAARSPTGSRQSWPTPAATSSTPRPVTPNARRGGPRQPRPRPAPTVCWSRWRQQPPPIETPCTKQRLAPSRHADATPPPSTDSTPPHAGNGAPPATTSTSPSDNSTGPRTTSNGPANEPPRPSNGTLTQSPTSGTRTTSSATATPSSSSTPCCPPPASSGSTSTPSRPGSTGPKATTSPTTPSVLRSRCSLTDRASSNNSPPPSATTSAKHQSSERGTKPATSTLPQRESPSPISASSCDPSVAQLTVTGRARGCPLTRRTADGPGLMPPGRRGFGVNRIDWSRAQVVLTPAGCRTGGTGRTKLLHQ